MTDTLAHVERIDWPDFLARFDWQQGEHVSIIGPTGTGKSHLGRAILPRRRYVVSLGTKRKDDTLTRYVTEDGFTRIDGWRPERGDALIYDRGKWRRPRLWEQLPDGWADRTIVWPRYAGKVAQRDQLAGLLAHVLDDAMDRGGFCVDVDEVYYLCKILGLTALLEEIWTQGRSGLLSLLGKTQRPAWVPLFMYDQPTHLFFFSDNDEENLRRVGGLGGLSARMVRATVASLPKHDVLYVNTRERAMAVTRAPAPGQLAA